jgi:hypothetical protein
MSLSVVAFLHITLLYLYPCHYTLHIIISHHLLSTNHNCTQPCPFPMLLKPAAQKLKKIWDSSTRSCRRAITLDRLPVELWSLSTAIFSRVFDLVFCKTLFMY